MSISIIILKYFLKILKYIIKHVNPLSINKDLRKSLKH